MHFKCGRIFLKFIHVSINHSFNHSIIQSINQSIIQSINYSFIHTIIHSFNQSFIQSIIQSINQSFTTRCRLNWRRSGSRMRICRATLQRVQVRFVSINCRIRFLLLLLLLFIYEKNNVCFSLFISMQRLCSRSPCEGAFDARSVHTTRHCVSIIFFCNVVFFFCDDAG